jgi:tetratricopeptide (TPR) repeat protein
MLVLLEKTPNENRSEVILRLMRDDLTNLPGWATKYLPRLETLLNTGIKNRFVERHLRFLISECYMDLLRKDDARRVIEPLGLIDRWWAAPVPTGVGSGRGRLYIETSVETAPSLDQTYTLGWRKIGWQDLYLPGLLGEITFERLRGLPYDVVYLQTQFKVEKAWKGFLVIETYSPLSDGIAVWVNGRRTALLDPADAEIPSELYLPVSFDAGWASVMVKLPESAELRGITVSLAEPDGTPLKVQVEQTLTVHETSAPLTAQTDVKVADALNFYRKLGSEGYLDKKELALVRASASGLASRIGLEEEAYELVSSAVTADPSSTLVKYLHAKKTSSYGRLAEGERKNRARDELRNVLKEAPDFVAARVDVAEDYMSEDKLPEAFAVIDAGLKDIPDSLSLRLAHLAMFRRAGENTGSQPQDDSMSWKHRPSASWFDNEKSELDAIEALAPDLPELPMLKSEYWEKRGQPILALKVVEDALKKSPMRWFEASCYRLYRRTGNTSKALDIGRKMEAAGFEPDGSPMVYPSTQLTDLLFELGQTDEALQRVDAVLKVRPFDVSFVMANKLSMLAESRRKDEVKTVLQQLLTLKPGLYPAITYLEKSDKKKPFYEPYVTMYDDHRAKVGGAEDYPRSSTVRIIDQRVCKILPDGSVISYNHEAAKVLTSAGIEQLKEQHISGAIIDIRTITADGEVLEPTILQGGITMPGLAIGAVVEYRSMEFEPSDDGRLDMGGWYFQDPKYDEPFLWSDYVVMAAKSLQKRLLIKKAHLGKISDPEPGGDEENLIYHWTALDMPMVQEEPSMPAGVNILPVIEVRTRDSWQRLNYDYLYEKSSSRPEDSIKKALAEALGKAGIDTKAPTEKVVNAVYNYVADVVVGDSGPHDAVAILSGKSGDRLVVIEAMLRAAGLMVRDASILSSPERQLFIPSGPIDWMNPSRIAYAEHALAVMADEGRWLWLRADDRYLPAGALSSDILGGTAFVTSASGGTFVPISDTPPITYWQRINTEFTLDDDKAQGSFSFSFDPTSDEGSRIKKVFNESQEARQSVIVRSIVNHFIKGADLVKWNVDGASDRNKPFQLLAEFKSGYLVNKGPRGYEVSLGMQPLNLVGSLIGIPERNFDMVLTGYQGEKDTVTIHFDPAKWAVERAPKGGSLALDFGTYNLECDLDAQAGVLKITRYFTMKPAVVTPALYGDLARLAKAADIMDTQKFILKPMK